MFTFYKATGKVKHLMAHSLSQRWVGSTPATKTEWGTIMKHCAIKGVPERMSGVWWASVSLQSSRAPQLISHQRGGGGYDHSSPSSPCWENGNHQPNSMCCYFHFYPPPLTLKSVCRAYKESTGWNQWWILSAIKYCVEKKNKEKPFGSAWGLFKPFNIFQKSQIDWETW